MCAVAAAPGGPAAEEGRYVAYPRRFSAEGTLVRWRQRSLRPDKPDRAEP